MCVKIFFIPVEKVKATEIEDESDRELIRVARGDVEDEEPREKPHKEKKRSTEGNCLKNSIICGLKGAIDKILLFLFPYLVVNKRNKRAAEEGKSDWVYLFFRQKLNYVKFNARLHAENNSKRARMNIGKMPLSILTFADF